MNTIRLQIVSKADFFGNGSHNVHNNWPSFVPLQRQISEFLPDSLPITKAYNQTLGDFQGRFYSLNIDSEHINDATSEVEN